MWKNKHFQSVQDVKALFEEYLNYLADLSQQIDSSIVQQLEVALQYSNHQSFKIIHPLLIKGYRMASFRFRDKPIDVIGIDIETNHKTGEPRLIGFYYPEQDSYFPLHKPDAEDFFSVLINATENSVSTFVTWGSLDLQAIIRLFKPSEDERSLISRGMSGNIQNGEIIGSPPVLRYLADGTAIYIEHYISGRSLKLGYIPNGVQRNFSIWIFNISQFYPGTIEQTAKGLGLPWKSFDKNTHLVDWTRYSTSIAYRNAVHGSNKQDARIVATLADSLQRRFYEVFECYPTLLVSTGSLTDAAVASMINDKHEYQANSWRWLVQHIWGDSQAVVQAENLLAEAYSAGYVDQFAIGYFSEIYTADISAAYPHKIRQLPDLRYSEIIAQDDSTDVEQQIKKLEADGWIIETAIIRGQCHIPKTLKFHPITVKTSNRENYRPTGIFYASYTLDERRYCQQHGAKFENEEWVIVALSERHIAPIGRVSERLGEYRQEILSELKKETDSDRKKLLDGQQYVVKVIDNSIYGKTVMTTEVVENVDGHPTVTGYIAGDRFNLLYGTLITARTRIQIAQACMDIMQAGGTPVMAMTDSVYWHGKPEHLPEYWIRQTKTPGYFEPVETVNDFYILKTGQYEYRKEGKWTYKLRGLPIDWDVLEGNQSFYHRLIREHTANLKSFTHPKDISINVPTRKLITIGNHDLDKLALVEHGEMALKPFVMSSKQQQSVLRNWKQAVNNHVWLETPYIDETVPATQQPPLKMLSDTYAQNKQEDTTQKVEHHRKRVRAQNKREDVEKQAFILKAWQVTGIEPVTELNKHREAFYKESWHTLENHFKITRKQLLELETNA